ncbi:MAG: TonB-dependent receptor [Gammaproteobacteria bacterium]
MKSITRRAVRGFGLLLAFPSLGVAAPAETMLVTAVRSESAPIDIPRHIDVIDRDEIDASPAGVLSDLLRGRAGVQVSDLYGDGSRTGIDLGGFGGTAADTTLILVDGRRLNNIDLGAPDLNAIPLEDIERVEILPGSAGVLYGDKAVGGVIQIVTRRPQRLHAQVDIAAGSFDRRDLRASIEQAFDNGLAYRVALQRRVTDNYRDHNALRYSHAAGEIEYRHARGRLFAEFGYADEFLQTPGALFADQVAADRRQAQNPEDFLRTRTHSFRTGLVQALPWNLELQAEYTNRMSTNPGVLSVGGFGFRQDLKRHHLEFTPRIVGRFDLPTGRATLTVGADVFDTDYSLVSDIGTTFDRQHQQAVYGQIVLPLPFDLVATAGGRHAEVENDIAVGTRFGGISLAPGSRIDDEADAVEGGLSWSPAPGWRLFARGGSHFRFVNADEYSGIANFNQFPFPAPLPLPTTQTGTGMDGGFEVRRGGVEADLRVFRLDVDDEIAFDSTTLQNWNIGDSRRHGVNVSARWQVHPALRVGAAYTFVDAVMTGGPFAGTDATFVAAHSGRAFAEYRFTAHARGYLELDGIGPRSLAGDFHRRLPELGGRVIANLKYGWESGPLGVTLRVGNLLDKRQSDAGALGFDFRSPVFPTVPTYFPAPGRNLQVTLRYRY